MKFQYIIQLAFVLGARAKENSLIAKNRGLIGGIESYQPKTVVTDYAAFDLDLRLIRSELDKDRESAFRTAQRVYQEGAFSRPVAELILDKELEHSISSGTEIIGTAYNHNNSSYTMVKGTTRRHASKGDRVLEVLYDVMDDQDDYVQCQVGANPTPNVNGCFAEQGSIQIPAEEKALNYTYDVLGNNINYRSFQIEVRYSRERLWDCESCPKPDYEKFVNYYGMHDYADHVIMRAFQGAQTDMERGNHDFRWYGWTGRREMVQNSIVWMIMWMEVISRMERSIDYCLDTQNTVDGALEFWDSSVAFYTGSQVEDGSGYLLFHLANNRCLSASTCGEDGDGDDGIAWVNLKVLENFQSGQGQINARNCEAARKNKEEIVRLMTIPLIQGALHDARVLHDKLESKDFVDYESRAGSGAAIVAAVLPLVHACDHDDADIILRNLQAASTSAVNFEDVRDAFARNLRCLGITCDEIGDVLELSDDMCAKVQAQAASRSKNGVNKENVDTDSPAKSGVVFMYAFITLSALVICFLGRKLVSKNRAPEKEITFPEPMASVPPVASKSIIRGTDYAPKYWKDCQETEEGKSSNQSLKDDEAIMVAEIL